MGKKGKTRRKMEKKAKKRAEKDQKRALYASFAAAGNNSKSFRFRKKAAKKVVTGISHPDGPCGNIACRRCSSVPDLIQDKLTTLYSVPEESNPPSHYCILSEAIL